MVRGRISSGGGWVIWMAGVVVLWRDFDSSIPRSVSFYAIRLVRLVAFAMDGIWHGFLLTWLMLRSSIKYVKNVVAAGPSNISSHFHGRSFQERNFFPIRNPTTYLPSIVVVPMRPPTNLCRKHNYTRVETKSLWFIEFVIDVEIQIQFKIVINFSLLASWVAWLGSWQAWESLRVCWTQTFICLFNINIGTYLSFDSSPASSTKVSGWWCGGEDVMNMQHHIRFHGPEHMKRLRIHIHRTDWCGEKCEKRKAYF